MSFIHPLADVAPEVSIGEKTNVWQYVVLLPGAVIGKECNICAHTLVEGGVSIGNRVTVKSGVYLWDGLVIEDDVFVGPNATFANDRFPRSKQHLVDGYTKTVLKKGVSIGANATVLPGVIVGVNAMVGAGAVVVNDVPPNAVVVGNPARIVRFIE